MRAARLAGGLCAGLLGAIAADAADACRPEVACAEVHSFTATVSSLRMSRQDGSPLLTLTVRFRNRTDQPLTLGYVTASGVIMDEHGNRYTVGGPNAVRGIGEIRSSGFDPKFTLAAQASSDARFELLWNGVDSTPVGTTFDIDLAVREFVPVGDQFRLGQEHALHYAAINEAKLTAAANATPVATPAPADPCAGIKSCFNAGPFVAEVQQVTPANFTAGARHHSVRLTLRFRNTGATRIVLGYKGATSTAIDNFGNTYYWGRAGTHDTSAQGIGLVTGRSADPQFALDPGQARTATFNVVRYNVNSPVGTAFQYDVVISELEVLSGQQVRSLRENSLTFAGLTAGTFNVAQTPAAGGPAATAPAPGAAPLPGVPSQDADVASKVIDLFKSITKKE
jgi:hypothetical protein